ncbi:MAG TPA: O-antigen ligase domain-containing protein, partial [Hellea balneolensis]|nr:O-antigen ligase domain-containing protein [Hellea balneolensis]
NPFKDGEEFAKRTADTIQNIGHGNSVLAIMFVPTALLAWMRGGKWRLFACNLAALVLFTTYISGTAANLVAVIAACLIMIIGYFWPKIALHLSFLVAGIVVTAAPILAFTASRLTPAFKAKLPFSWEERVENWSYLYDRIFEKPVFGHGFDAVRTFTETHTIRGFPDRAYVSLHPHNAGLHIWVELGFVGAVMVYFALYLGAKHLTQPGRLNHGQMVATAGLVMSATVISSLSYGVWQDWWWATVILGASVISLIRTAPRVGK